jgi:hypothetical protein
MRAHQPGSEPLDIPEAIPNPAVPQPVRKPASLPREPIKVPAPQKMAYNKEMVARDGVVGAGPTT